MKSIYTFFLISCFFCSNSNWLVVGAGPAGIITVSVLLEIGTDGSDITWIDPYFGVGELSKYPNTPANSPNQSVIEFLKTLKFFSEINDPSINKIFELNPDLEYPLSTIISPLQAITDYICSNRVNYVKTRLNSLEMINSNWVARCDSGGIVASHVVLATGSSPRALSDLNGFSGQKISLVDALDPLKISKMVSSDDVVAVVGSSHSAILATKFLYDSGVSKIYNFFNKPLIYSYKIGSEYAFPSSGLSGVAASWAKEYLENIKPQNIVRLQFNNENLSRVLPACSKLVCAVGFEPNQVGVKDCDILSYNNQDGQIGCRLFGIGIAFPEKTIDPLGNEEFRVGIQSFIRYAMRVVPEWSKRKGAGLQLLEKCKRFEDLFYIKTHN